MKSSRRGGTGLSKGSQLGCQAAERQGGGPRSGIPSGSIQHGDDSFPSLLQVHTCRPGRGKDLDLTNIVITPNEMRKGTRDLGTYPRNESRDWSANV